MIPESHHSYSGRCVQMRRNLGSTGSLGAELAEGASAIGLASGRSLSGYDSANEGDGAA